MGCCVVTGTFFIDSSGMCCPRRMDCSRGVLCSHWDMFLLTLLVCVVQCAWTVVMGCCVIVGVNWIPWPPLGSLDPFGYSGLSGGQGDRETGGLETRRGQGDRNTGRHYDADYYHNSHNNCHNRRNNTDNNNNINKKKLR